MLKQVLLLTVERMRGYDNRMIVRNGLQICPIDTVDPMFAHVAWMIDMCVN